MVCLLSVPDRYRDTHNAGHPPILLYIAIHIITIKDWSHVG
jgi:hypothetical protein